MVQDVKFPLTEVGRCTVAAGAKSATTNLFLFKQPLQLLPVRLHLAPFSTTGKMPVPQKVSFLVGWASCPPKKCKYKPISI